MKKILLTKGKFAIVDDEDVVLVSQYNWFASRCWGGSDKYRAGTTINGKKVLMHRMLLGYPDSDIDHKNGDALDNRRHNLRLCTGTQNQGNVSARSSSKSGYKGVYYRQRPNFCWEAQLQYRYHRYFLGIFETVEEAVTAYGLHAIAAFGEFARISVSPKEEQK